MSLNKCKLAFLAPSSTKLSYELGLEPHFCTRVPLDLFIMPMHDAELKYILLHVC